MIKWRKILAALLAVAMLAVLAACSNDKDAKQADNDFKFMQGERITRADLDYFASLNPDLKELDMPESDLVHILAIMRAVMLDAESLGVVVSWDEARAYAEERYQEFQVIIKDENNPEYDLAKWNLDQVQRLNEELSISQDEYLDGMALNRQVMEAYQFLRERFIAELPPDVQEDMWARESAVNDYLESLIEKYYDELVEEDLQPLLDEYYAK